MGKSLEEGENAAGVVGKLMASLYGTSDASANWQVKAGKYPPLHILQPTNEELCVVLCMETTLYVLGALRT